MSLRPFRAAEFDALWAAVRRLQAGTAIGDGAMRTILDLSASGRRGCTG
jgi:hypothetical protein